MAKDIKRREKGSAGKLLLGVIRRRNTGREEFDAGEGKPTKKSREGLKKNCVNTAARGTDRDYSKEKNQFARGTL